MSLTSEATTLFVKALERGEKNLAEALAPFTELKEILYRVSNTENFDWDANAGLLRRATYTRDEADKLAAKTFLKDSAYRRALSGAISACEDKNSLEDLFEYLMRAGGHDLALQIVDKVPNRVQMSIALGADFDRWRNSKGTQSCLYAVGSGESICLDTFKILDKLGVSLPAYLSASEYSRSPYYNDEWQHDRFAIQAELVGSTMDAEKIEIPSLSIKNGQPHLEHSALAKAFFESRHHAENLGGWHADVFPALVPVIIDEKDSGALAKIGGFLITPVFEFELTDRNGKLQAYPHHGFKDPSGALTDIEVMLSTSLLSYEQVAKLRDDEFQKNKRVGLLPAELIPALDMDDANPSENLSFAVRHHRPEPLLLAYGKDNWCSDYLATRIYLKGVPSVVVKPSGDQKSLALAEELTADHSMADYLTSQQELQWLSTYIRERHHPPKKYTLLKHDDTISDEQNLEVLLKNLSHYHASIGPGVEYRVSAPAAFYEFMEKKKLGLTLPIEFTVPGNKPPEGWNLHERVRLRTSLGYGFASLMESIGTKPEDWLTKAVRSKDEGVRQQCMGLLDRIPLEQVVKLATSEPRAQFLLDNFDLAPMSEMLPPRLKDRVMTKRFATDLGL
ncbi:hypothetical protein [Pseudomonas amygdali]|uniref:Uncharacterized protein n=2 Tax=Pseudomonas amygdali pv. lachrymans TaxID=53707 RepID=A0ABR5KSG2_PSEAV|nr:hypothetical protein [Pseudomonas amygdali]AXH60345.1 hypothetical protein PLA107_034810 [Pseudomonas amygdali pv. lachrymans str. M301315]KPC17733.1 Uncharacterized protein AC499_0935 [Pseudomonas amygdali pv. lachrymans]